ncbi:hypothetical protein BDV18DRAFT_164019 [Aspergillus unguis]
MARLLDLPNELLILIASYFDSYMWKNELKSLCLTSKLLCSVSQPMLYTQFIREVQCQCCQKTGPPSGRIVPLVLFIRTLITRPDLAGHVRSAHMDAGEDEFDRDAILKAYLDAETIKVLASGFQELQEDDRARWFMEAVSMMSNPCFVLFASLVPNLERLALTLEEEGMDGLEPLFTVWSSSGIEQPYLRNLKSLGIWDLSHSESDSLHCISHAMTLPQLEYFALIGLNGGADGCPYFDFEPGSLNISNLHLLDACLDADSLETIVAGCKCLEFFTYSGHNFDGNSMDISCQFDPSELIPILSSQKKNLQTICCNLDWETISPTRNQWKKLPKYGSFATFENICHLEVDQYPWDQRMQELPPSLQCLTIRNISFSIFDTVKSLNRRTIQDPSRSIHGDLPNLRRLILEPRDRIPNGMLEVRKRFDFADVYESTRVAEKFEEKCDMLLVIAEACTFHIEVKHEVWEWYMEY